MAKSKRHSREIPGDLIKMDCVESHSMAYSSCTLPRKGSSVHSQSHQTEHIYDSPADFLHQHQQTEVGKTSSFTGSAPNSPAHNTGHYASPWKKKTPPPPPPKRTNSIKTDGRSFLSELKKSETNTSSSCSNLTTVAVGGGQQQALSSCIATLSQRFGAQRERSEPPAPVAPPQVPTKPKHVKKRPPSPAGREDFPPPPPPISVDVGGSGGHNKFSFTDSDNPLGDVIESLEKGQVSPPSKTITNEGATAGGSNGHGNGKNAPNSKGMKLGDWQDSRHSDSGEDSDSGLESRRNESTTSLDSASSDSSTNTLPFANENVGTIKQRSAANKPSIVTVSNGDADGSDSKSVDLNSSLFEDSTGTIKRNPHAGQSQGPSTPQKGN